jgi:hypothetical protein
MKKTEVEHYWKAESYANPDVTLMPKLLLPLNHTLLSLHAVPKKKQAIFSIRGFLRVI